MTRDAGQVSTRHALAGAVAVLGAVAVVIGGLTALVPAVDRVVELPAPADGWPGTCPTDEDLNARPGPVAVSAELLLECPRAFDGRSVTYSGEVVRAVLLRGERAWVQLNDDPYALAVGPLPEARTSLGGNSGIPVSISADAARAIGRVGSARAAGDVLEVEGVFVRADPADDGAPALRADAVRITRTGHALVRPADLPRAAVALAMSLLAGASTWAARRARR